MDALDRLKSIDNDSAKGDAGRCVVLAVGMWLSGRLRGCCPRLLHLTHDLAQRYLGSLRAQQQRAVTDDAFSSSMQRCRLLPLAEGMS